MGRWLGLGGGWGRFVGMLALCASLRARMRSAACGRVRECGRRERTGIFTKSSKSRTGLFTSEQHDHDLDPSWKTGAPGWYEQLSGPLFSGEKSWPHPLCVQRTIAGVCRRLMSR